MADVTQKVRLRASGLTSLFDCPHRWEGEHLLGMRLPTTGRQQVGTSVHRGAEVFDSSRVGGAIGLLPDDAVAAAVDAVRSPFEDVDWSDIGGVRKAEQAAVMATMRYVTQVGMKEVYEAVELKCEPLLVDAGDVILEITGTTDRIRTERRPDPADPSKLLEERGIRDLKTGKAVVDGHGRVKAAVNGAQLAVYELLAIMSGKDTGKTITLPADIVGINTTNGAVARATVDAPHKVLVGDGTNKGMLQYAADLIKSGSFYGNPRSTLCSNRYCARWNNCRFRFNVTQADDGPDIDP